MKTVTATDDFTVHFAQGLVSDLARAGVTVSMDVAVAASVAHVNQGKDAAMAVLVAAGVPMTKKAAGGTSGLSTRTATQVFSVNKRTIFEGWDV
jgi:hypothetical protein